MLRRIINEEDISEGNLKQESNKLKSEHLNRLVHKSETSDKTLAFSPPSLKQCFRYQYSSVMTEQVRPNNNAQGHLASN